MGVVCKINSFPVHTLPRKPLIHTSLAFENGLGVCETAPIEEQFYKLPDTVVRVLYHVSIQLRHESVVDLRIVHFLDLRDCQWLISATFGLQEGIRHHFVLKRIIAQSLHGETFSIGYLDVQEWVE